MSADEDTELRDLVAQTLESNGVLGKIRAQLRASVFLALEEQESVQNKTPFQNQELKKFNSTREGRLVTALVKEFLEYFNLEFTQAVFDPETGFGDHYEGRNSVARDLDIIESDGSKKAPLLSEVVKRLSGNRDARGRLGSDSQQTSSGLTSTINSTVESKNKKNLESTAAAKLEPLSKLTLGDLKDSSVRDSFEDDPFFDDPVPVNKETRSFPGGDKNREKDDKGSISKGSGGSGGMSSLAGLPSLTNPEPQKSPKSPDLEKDIKAIDQRIADLGFDVPEDDYEDDFNSSDVSPFGITPRSDKNIKSIDEDIDEDIEEDLSVAEDLLKSDNSAHDDLTTDRTISPTEQSAAFDYMEDVLSP